MSLRSLLAGRTRLVDGLVVAAAALLALKGIGLLVSAEPESGPDGLPRFAHVLGYARTNYVPPDPTTTGSIPDAPKPAPVAAPAPAEPTRPVPASPAERSILERLGERREELQLRAREMETREKLLEEAERRLDARAAAEAGTPGDKGAAAAVPAAEAEAAAAMRSIVTMYETMKPKDAARVFDRLPHDVLVPVVRQVNPRKMAEILAAMSPEGAEKLTVALARTSRRAEERAVQAPGLPPGELPAVELPAAARPAAAPRR